MDKLQSQLSSWVLQYLKNKDLVRKEIVDIKEKTNHSDFIISYTNRDLVVVVEPNVLDISKSLLHINQALNEVKTQHVAWFVLNTKENLKQVLNEWNNIIPLQHLGVYFTNPQSKTDKVWVVFPCTHNKISTKSTIKTLFNNVEEIKKN